MSEARETLPVVPFIKKSADGDAYLEGSVCTRCDTTFLGRRLACSKCGSRDEMVVRPLAKRGTLHTFTIVHRSFPGVAVPYVSAVVDLEGGGSIKGNLINVEPDPAQLAFGMPVEVVFGDALGRKDAKGNSYVSYFFQPAGAGTAREEKSRAGTARDGDPISEKARAGTAREGEPAAVQGASR